MRRATALAIIKCEWAEHGKDTLQSTRAFIENRVSKQARDKAAEEGREIYLHACATAAAKPIKKEKEQEPPTICPVCGGHLEADYERERLALVCEFCGVVWEAEQ